MASAVVQFRNAAEIDRVLYQMSRAFGPGNALKPLQNTIRGILKPLVPQVRALTSVDKGLLRESVKIRVGRGRDRYAPDLYGTLGYRVRSPIFRGRAVAATLEEYGADGPVLKEPPRSAALARVFDRNRSRLISDFNRLLPIEVRKTMIRFSRRVPRYRL